MRKFLLAATAAALVQLGLMGNASAAELRYAAAGDIYGLDPDSMTDSFSNNFLSHIYEPLVRYNKELKIEPALALSWEVVKPDVVRFKLRQGVKFHDGADFGADDVVMSLMRAVDENSPIKGNLPALKSVEKIDDYTVDLHLAGPTPLLNNYLTNIAVFDAGWLENNNAVKPINAELGQEGYTSTHANGTGPFKLESRRPDAQTVLVANEGWWDKPQHNLTKIIFTPIASDATRVAALLSGEVDIITPSPLQDAKRIAANPGTKVLENPGLRTIMMNFNMRDKLVDGNVEGNPFKDARVRKAVYQAINMDLVRDKIMRGKSRVSGMQIAPEVPGFDAKLNERFPYDPAAAKALLTEAGYPDGFQFNMNCPNDAYVNDEEVCQAMTAMLAQVGLNAKLVTEARTLHFKKAQEGQTDMFMIGWATLPMLDGFSVLSAMLHSPEEKLGTWNPGGYTNAKVDELVKKIDVELDETKRREMMVEAFAITEQEVAWLPLHQQPLSWAVRDNVEVVQTADDLLRLWYVNVK
ncbi:ABC transporter substrate-binding protein [Aminobacter carboxidus]|uniref:ABC transporter substrate-binding protein n=1 Tax=Aminobacter carboxidus TaxID=376165 RepID=A0A8E2BEP8_9HYPH|nr:MULTISPECIES: ABC transporter substrate-binding protein [Aminobacter carboxidus group]MBB6467095.1 peptide/nickel transport system substrate-binding protein [Aminobacter lissarensis]MBE1202859.1 ABC transporter substrate-binding protein [Aminobacter carboxidus]